MGRSLGWPADFRPGQLRWIIVPFHGIDNTGQRQLRERVSWPWKPNRASRNSCLLLLALSLLSPRLSLIFASPEAPSPSSYFLFFFSSLTIHFGAGHFSCKIWLRTGNSQSPSSPCYCKDTLDPFSLKDGYRNRGQQGESVPLSYQSNTHLRTFGKYWDKKKHMPT